MNQLDKLIVEGRRVQFEIIRAESDLDIARREASVAQRKVAKLERSVGQLRKALETILVEIAALRETTTEENPYIATLGEDYAWVWDYRFRDSFNEYNLIIARTSEFEESLAQTLRSVREDLHSMSPEDRANTQVAVLLSEDVTYNQLWVAHGSRWGPDYIPGDVFDCAGIHIVGPTPELSTYRGMDEAAPQEVACSAFISADKSLPGGACIKISPGTPDVPVTEFAKLHFWGVGMLSRARSAVSINSGRPFIFKNTACSMSMDPRSIGPDDGGEKWGMQLYQVSPDFYDCWWHLDDIKEHPIYCHGHAPNFNLSFRNILSTACGGQVMQFTERKYEAPDAPADYCLIMNCVFTGFGQDASRASKAITFTGAGLHAEIIDTVVVDNDPTDTAGQSANRKNTSYGCLTVWSPEGDKEAYRNAQGVSNESLTVRNSIMAIRNPNRPIASFSDCGLVDIESTWFMTAGTGGSNGWPQANYNNVDVQVLNYDGTSDPDQIMIDRATILMEGTMSDYVKRPIRAQNGRPGYADLQPNEVGQLLGRLSPHQVG
jgi:hypothetical protein